MSRTLHLTLLAAVITAAAASCPSSEWTQFRDICYWGRSDDVVYWYEVAHLCNTIYPGAEMVTIHDIALNAFIAEYIASRDGSRDYAWIGLSRASSSSDWHWTDGSAVNYTVWFANDDDSVGGDCALINYGQWGMWAGFNCDTYHFYFMCQVAALWAVIPTAWDDWYLTIYVLWHSLTAHLIRRLFRPGINPSQRTCIVHCALCIVFVLGSAMNCLAHVKYMNLGYNVFCVGTIRLSGLDVCLLTGHNALTENNYWNRFRELLITRCKCNNMTPILMNTLFHTISFNWVGCSSRRLRR